MIRSFSEVIPHFRSNHPKVLVDRKIAATIPREDSPVKIKPYLCKREQYALDIFGKPNRMSHTSQAWFFSI